MRLAHDADPDFASAMDESTFTYKNPEMPALISGSGVEEHNVARSGRAIIDRHKEIPVFARIDGRIEVNIISLEHFNNESKAVIELRPPAIVPIGLADQVVQFHSGSLKAVRH